jgi:hypothetical protein
LTCFAGTAYRPYRPAKGQSESLKVMRCFRIHFLNFCSLVFKDPSCSRPPTSDDSTATGWLLRGPLLAACFGGRRLILFCVLPVNFFLRLLFGCLAAAFCCRFEGGGLYLSASAASTAFFSCCFLLCFRLLFGPAPACCRFEGGGFYLPASAASTALFQFLLFAHFVLRFAALRPRTVSFRGRGV